MATVITLPRNFLLSENQAIAAGKGIFEPKTLLVKIKPEATVSVEVNERVKVVVRKVMEQSLDHQAQLLAKSIGEFVDRHLESNPGDVEGTRDAVIKIIENSEGPTIKLMEMEVKKALDKEAKQDTHLKEAKVKVVLKAIANTVKLTTTAIRLGTTGGADLHAWYTLASTIKEIAEMVHEALKTEDTFRKEFQNERNGLEEDFKSLEKVRKEHENTSGPGSLFTFIEKGGRWVVWKKQCGKTEESRVKLRNSVYKSRKEIDKIAEPIKKLEAEMKAAPSLKEGIQIGASVMTLKRQVRLAVEAYDKKIQILEELANDLATLGLEVDDRTIVEKFKAIPVLLKSKHFVEFASTSKDCFDSVKQIYDACSEIKDLCKEVVKLVK